MKVHCFHCGHEYEVASELVGQRMDCEACRKAFTLRDEAADAAAQAKAAKKPNDFKLPPKPKPRKLGRPARKPVLKMPAAAADEAGRHGGGPFRLRLVDVPVRVGSFHILLMFALLLACIWGGASFATRFAEAPTLLLGAVCAVMVVFMPLALLWVLGTTRASALRQEHIERLLAEIASRPTPPPPPKKPAPPPPAQPVSSLSPAPSKPHAPPAPPPAASAPQAPKP